MFQSAGSLAPLLRTIFNLLRESSLTASVDMETASSDTRASSSSSSFVVETVLLHWTAFLRAVEHLLYRVPFCRELVRSDLITMDRKLDTRIGRLPGVQELLERFSTSPVTLATVLRGWVEAFLATRSESKSADEMVDISHEWTVQLAKQYRFFPAVQHAKGSHSRFNLSPLASHTPCYSSYPCEAISGPQLIDLPPEYTQLHSAITSLCDYEYPALCLVCGAILNANGSRQCCLHTMECGGEGGIFFLLQDCSVLLCHGYRCSYFPTPYVDKYGEGHQSYRGKPLHLDMQIYNAMRKMWASHNIP